MQLSILRNLTQIWNKILNHLFTEVQLSTFGNAVDDILQIRGQSRDLLSRPWENDPQSRLIFFDISKSCCAEANHWSPCFLWAFPFRGLLPFRTPNPKDFLVNSTIWAAICFWDFVYGFEERQVAGSLHIYGFMSNKRTFTCTA